MARRGRKTRFCKTTPCIKKSSLFIKDMTMCTSGTSGPPERPFRSALRARASGETHCSQAPSEDAEPFAVCAAMPGRKAGSFHWTAKTGQDHRPGAWTRRKGTLPSTHQHAGKEGKRLLFIVRCECLPGRRPLEQLISPRRGHLHSVAIGLTTDTTPLQGRPSVPPTAECPRGGG